MGLAKGSELGKWLSCLGCRMSDLMSGHLGNA